MNKIENFFLIKFRVKIMNCFQDFLLKVRLAKTF